MDQLHEGFFDNNHKHHGVGQHHHEHDVGEAGSESHIVLPEDEQIREIYNEFDDWKSTSNLDLTAATELPNPPYVPFIPHVPDMADMNLWDLDDKESTVDIKQFSPILTTVHSLNNSWSPLAVAPTYEVVEETTPMSSSTSLFSSTTAVPSPISNNISMISFTTQFPEFPKFPEFPNVSLFN